jgi:hypothetical protein
MRNALGMITSGISHTKHEGRQNHDDHAVTTLIIEQTFNDNAETDHDDGLVHSHNWANQAA